MLQRHILNDFNKYKIKIICKCLLSGVLSEKMCVVSETKQRFRRASGSVCQDRR